MRRAGAEVPYLPQLTLQDWQEAQGEQEAGEREEKKNRRVGVKDRMDPQSQKIRVKS